MYVNENESEDSGDPETLQDDEAILLKQQHAKYVLNNMMKLSRGMVG